MTPKFSTLAYAPGTPDRRFLSEERCRALVAQILGFASGVGRTDVSIGSNATGVVRWARNRISVAEEWRDNQIAIGRGVTGAQGNAALNQIDAVSIQAAVRCAERELRLGGGSGEPDDFAWPPVTQSYPATHIWSEETYAQAPDARSTIANQLVESAERAGMLSAGDIVVAAAGVSIRSREGLFLYAPSTEAQCSLTVRDPQGTGSGWAGCSSYDWNRLDAAKLAAIALEKCLTSRNPVTIEPGRYITILEPQATYDFMQSIMGLDREYAESSTASPWHVGPINSGQTKLTQRVIDERVSVHFDPLDPDLGVIPFTGEGEPMVPATWIDHGVLTNLAYRRQWALENLHESAGKPNSRAFRMSWSAAPVSMKEMIATTTRGLLVTRFWDVSVVDPPSLLSLGMTRDGVWLIEHGKIVKPVKNFRFLESPLFSLNSLEQMGAPVPVFSPGTPALVPPVKVRDFNFVALVDAV